jgi:hypothetical protein
MGVLTVPVFAITVDLSQNCPLEECSMTTTKTLADIARDRLADALRADEDAKAEAAKQLKQRRERERQETLNAHKRWLEEFQPRIETESINFFVICAAALDELIVARCSKTERPVVLFRGEHETDEYKVAAHAADLAASRLKNQGISVVFVQKVFFGGTAQPWEYTFYSAKELAPSALDWRRCLQIQEEWERVQRKCCPIGEPTFQLGVISVHLSFETK